MFKRKPTAYAVPPGVRVYAIGDIHGRLDLLDSLLRRIEADHQTQPTADVEVVFLGDYIDRGPASTDVMNRLVAGPPSWARWTLLKGNHEDAMLDLLIAENPEVRALELWLANGGIDTLSSYGMPAAITYGDSAARTIAALRDAVPAAHVELLKTMPHSHRIGDYLFVHAGIRPGVALDDQSPHDLMWIRRDFLDCKDDHGVMVVHGHTITPAVEERPNRIGIDTGAYRSGRLTALVLEGETRRTLSTLE